MLFETPVTSYIILSVYHEPFFQNMVLFFYMHIPDPFALYSIAR
jgi:hypothetical protein